MYLRSIGYRQALIEVSIITHAALAAYSIQPEFDAAHASGLQTTYGVYLLDARRVWAPAAGNAGGSGLTPAPRDQAALAELGKLVLRSARISALISRDT